MSNSAGRPLFRLAATGAVLALLAGCDDDFDFGNLGPGLGGANRNVQVETEPRPAADQRGVLSYPGYQMAVARRDDTVADVAQRIGMAPGELARHNGLDTGYILREGEILALPHRVPETDTGSGVDIASVAGSAIDRAEGQTAASTDQGVTTGRLSDPDDEPVRHRVERGETAYSIARLYNVSVRSLAEWNGLGSDLNVREGQYLLIPVAAAEPPRREVAATAPGQGSPTPVPPSASTPLPDEDVETAALPESPQLGDQQTARSTGGKFLYPVDGKVIRGYGKDGNDGIDLSAASGTAVRAADDGEVALVSRSVGQSTIVLVRHESNIYTVYSNIVDVPLKKGERVKRGQPVGKVAAGSPSFVHFEVRRGTKSTDPGPFLN